MLFSWAQVIAYLTDSYVLYLPLICILYLIGWGVFKKVYLEIRVEMIILLLIISFEVFAGLS